MPPPLPHSVVSLQSSLILGGTLPSKLGKSTLSSVPSVLSSFHFSFAGSPFCTPLTLKRGIKRPWIGQEVGVSLLVQIPKEMQSKGKKGYDERILSWSFSSPLLFTNWLSPRLFSLSPFLFFVQSLFSRKPFFLRLHLLAGVIKDLTDTLDEQCRESVKQVVIKTDAVSLWRERWEEIKKERERWGGKEDEWSQPRRARKRKRVKFIIYSRIYESPSGYFTHRELDCKVEINIIRYEVRMSASRGEEECNKYEKLQVETKVRVVRHGWRGVLL